MRVEGGREIRGQRTGAARCQYGVGECVQHMRRPTTRLSGPLTDAVRIGDIILRYLRG